MSDTIARRRLLAWLLALYGCGGVGTALLDLGAARAESSDGGVPFDWDRLVGMARDLAARPYVPPVFVLPPALAALDWDQYISIHFRPEAALWRDRGLAFQVRFFHLGLYHKQPVAMHELAHGVARRIGYASRLFDYGRNRFDPPLPSDLDFAGFRLHYHTDFSRDMVAFLGASYFRAVGGEMQYGLSARGLAVDTGLARPEEFPAFRAFWLERPAPGTTSVVVYGLLDSKSIAGAYRFAIHPGGTTTMDVSARLFARQAIERLGIAPLTSMFTHGENDRRVSDDYRPEVHDSDGLALWTGSSEWIWRPLANPPALRVNTFLDDNPRGFGLLQRDRAFADYQDDGVYYDRRPNLWVEPLGPWGRGTVTLVEIPTEDETFDNVVAFWQPADPVESGKEIEVAYRLHWGSAMPGRLPGPARALATRIGRGGIPGQKRAYVSHKFVIDFAGGDLAALAKDARVEPVISTSRGTIEQPAARPVADLGSWRVYFDLRAEGGEPVDLRCYLRLGDSALSETWLYQWTPPQ